MYEGWTDTNRLLDNKNAIGSGEGKIKEEKGKEEKRVRLNRGGSGLNVETKLSLCLEKLYHKSFLGLVFVLA